VNLEILKMLSLSKELFEYWKEIYGGKYISAAEILNEIA
jgi:hypothetical protein